MKVGQGRGSVHLLELYVHSSLERRPVQHIPPCLLLQLAAERTCGSGSMQMQQVAASQAGAEEQQQQQPEPEGSGLLGPPAKRSKQEQPQQQLGRRLGSLYGGGGSGVLGLRASSGTAVAAAARLQQPHLPPGMPAALQARGLASLAMAAARAEQGSGHAAASSSSHEPEGSNISSGSSSEHISSEWDSEECSQDTVSCSASGGSSGREDGGTTSESPQQPRRRAGGRAATRSSAAVLAAGPAAAPTEAAARAAPEGESPAAAAAPDKPKGKYHKSKKRHGPGLCCNCGATESYAWSRAPAPATGDLCQTCAMYYYRTKRMRPQELWGTTLHTKGRARCCFHCGIQQTRHWYYSQDRQDMCATCWQWSRRNGGTLRPLFPALPDAHE